MKKDKVFLAGTLALVTALTFTACDNPSGGGGSTPGGTVITGVTVNPATANVTKGGTAAFTATVAGTGDPVQTVSWTLSGGGEGTTISAAGVLVVAVNETATNLTITATSTVDTTKSGTAVVSVSGAATVSGVTVYPGTASVAKGGTAAFTATVAGTGNPAQTVTWTLNGGGEGTAINPAGVLSVAANETAENLTITATSTVDTSKSGTAAVTVPTVSTVTVSPGTASVAKGGTQTFTAEVTGTGDPAQTVTWTLNGGGEGTTINPAGVLVVAANETAESLTITATSTVDTSKSGTAVVTVPAVSAVTVSPGTASVAKGGTQTFTAVVTGTGDPAQTVTWTLSGGGEGTTISAAGVLVVAANETATSLTVTATSTADTSKSGTAVVTITSFTVSAVTVSPGTVSVAKGGTQTFTAVVTGTGDPAQTVTWTLSGGGTGTTISAAGVLVVAANETAVILTVTATSTVDTTKSGTAAVMVLPYTALALVTPNAVDSVTIAGNSAYYYSSSSSYMGVFIANRTVNLSPFQIAKYETTYELWYAVKQWATSNGYTFANAGREGHDGTDGAAPTTAAKTEPVTYINWRDAVIWCNAYSEMSGKEPVYYTDTTYTTVVKTSTNTSGTGTAADNAKMKPGANGYRLPTEAEWEYAARGGGTPSTTGSFAYRWAGTNTESALGTYAWYSSNSGSATHTVGGKTANNAQLYDMSGNVWEWCWDWYSGTVSTGTANDPTGPTSGADRVVRGGSWGNNASDCAVAYRNYNSPGSRSSSIGFRVVLCP